MPQQYYYSLYILLGALTSFLIVSGIIRYLKRSGHPLGESLLPLRIFIIPLATIYLFLWISFKSEVSAVYMKVLETVFWVGCLWIALSAFQSLFYVKIGNKWLSSIPNLFLDIVRLAVIAFGTSVIIASVWNINLAAFLATLGVGSIVLGLALQDTLGNLMAGIALLFEKPFETGDWISVGDSIGKVREINWRAVRLETRSMDVVVVPNSVIGKEKITNFGSSKTANANGVDFELGFSYDDPPNKVKSILMQTAHSTSGVLRNHRVTVRTLKYADSTINYHVRFFIDDYEYEPEISEAFLTRVWYAARRNGLTIPFPIRTVYKMEMPPPKVVDYTAEVKSIMKKIALFSILEADDLEMLALEAVKQDFARDEIIFARGEIGDAMYVIAKGSVAIVISEDGIQEHELVCLKAGDLFGEMSVLTGDVRSATVRATQDLEVLAIFKDAVERIIRKNPKIADEMARIVAERNAQLRAVAQGLAEKGVAVPATKESGAYLLSKIKNFFKV